MGTTEGQRELICESCGSLFSCCPVPQGNCWCAGVGISSPVLEKIKAEFKDCICPECLEKHARRGRSAPSA